MVRYVLGVAVTPLEENVSMDKPRIPMTFPQAPPVDPGDSLVIDCSTCSEQYTTTCDDCVVSFLLGRRPGEALVVDLQEHRSLRILADAGLAPPLRHRQEGG
tara:strand:- start:8473 stop:8778 length:306 start_codon:yes stop_codon:yes gene_type:complete